MTRRGVVADNGYTLVIDMHDVIEYYSPIFHIFLIFLVCRHTLDAGGKVFLKLIVQPVAQIPPFSSSFTASTAETF